MAEKEIFKLSQIDREELFAAVWETTKKEKKLDIAYISKEGKVDDGKKFYLTEEHIKNAITIMNAVWETNNMSKATKKELIRISKLDEADIYKSLEYVKATGKYFAKHSEELTGKHVELFDDVVLNEKTNAKEFGETIYMTAVSLIKMAKESRTDFGLGL